MRLLDFDFALPDELIAQEPAIARDGARLYVLPREGTTTSPHAAITDLPRLLPAGALLIVNDTRVIPARLRGRKPSGGRVELLLVEPSPDHDASRDDARPGGWREVWTCLGGASKAIRAGTTLVLDGERAPSAEVLSVRGAEVDVAFSGPRDGGDGLLAAAERIGEVPLPPYIRRETGPTAADRARYQTVYARTPGSSAAPTAGLHLSPALLDALDARGIERAAITLHVGLGTFAPLRVAADAPLDDVRELHAERYVISGDTARRIAVARAAGRPVIAVGTTTVRAVESAAALDEAGGTVRPGAGTTRLFLRPGDDGSARPFRVVDGLLTNFHLPRSTLLMLVAAFAGRDRVLAAYRDAVAARYRFFSYGDAMLIVNP